MPNSLSIGFPSKVKIHSCEHNKKCEETPMIGILDGKVALVTSVGSGIGRATAVVAYSLRGPSSR
jgi:hypothetical protein